MPYKDPARQREWKRAWRKKNPGHSRFEHLRAKYGLTKDDFQRLWDLQDGRCAICKKTLSAPCIDHCHNTGRVRGLLCNFCNVGLGFIEKMKPLSALVKDYLRRTS